MKTSPRLPLLILSITFVTACTTSKHRELDTLSSSSNQREVIVRQADVNTPVVSQRSRQYWVDLRKKTKNPEEKLYATLASGSWNAAEGEARQFLQKNPKNPMGLVVLATSLSMQKKYALAAYYANAYEKAHGTSPESLNLKGLFLMTQPRASMSDFKKAADLFSEAFQNNSTDIASGLNLGHLYLELGSAQLAADTFAQVRSRCSSCLPSLLGSGIAHSRLKNFDQARQDFQNVLKKQRHHPQALYRLALVTYLGDKDVKRAKKYLDELMTYAPDNAILVRQKSEALVRAMDAEGDPNDLPAVADMDLEHAPPATKLGDKALPVSHDEQE